MDPNGNSSGNSRAVETTPLVAGSLVKQPPS
jgi:hypothetical protein